MRPSAKLILRFLVVVAVATAVTVLYGPPSGSNTPYMSALSDLTLGTPALAAQCGTTHCDSTGTICLNEALRRVHCTFSGTLCITKRC